MRFHLDLNPGICSDKIQHRDTILLSGSCFSEHIEKKLNDLKFKCFSNPFGIVFNPNSIDITITRILEKNYFTDKDISEHNDTYLSLETHTSFIKFTKAELLSTLNGLIEAWHTHLTKADWLVITLGSAFYYRHLKTNTVAANCHKLPGREFSKQICETNTIVSNYNALLEKLNTFNPELKIILTVSPVKHLRDGIIQNNLSKAILIQSVHQIINKNKNCIYFPAYELVNDDLRDYRFYDPDMAHPNQQAIDYVWNKFSDMFFDKDTHALITKLNELNLSLNHRPLNTTGKAFSDFKSLQVKKCLELKTQYPYLDLDTEIRYFS